MENFDYKAHLEEALEGARQQAEKTANEAVILSITPTMGRTTVLIRIGLETYQIFAAGGAGKADVEELSKGIVEAGEKYAKL